MTVMSNATHGRRLLVGAAAITLLLAAAVGWPIGSRLLLQRTNADLDRSFRAPATGGMTVFAVRYRELPRPVADELAARVEDLARAQIPRGSGLSQQGERDRKDGAGGYV